VDKQFSAVGRLQISIRALREIRLHRPILCQDAPHPNGEARVQLAPAEGGRIAKALI
jgi:hypothetical protein